MSTADDPFRLLTEDVLAEVAVKYGACVHPVISHVRDIVEQSEQLVAIPCGATMASKCPSCSEKARPLRLQQCREGWP